MACSQNRTSSPDQQKRLQEEKNRREMEDEIGMLILLGIGLLCVVPMLLLIL